MFFNIFLVVFNEKSHEICSIFQMFFVSLHHETNALPRQA